MVATIGYILVGVDKPYYCRCRRSILPPPVRASRVSSFCGPQPDIPPVLAKSGKVSKTEHEVIRLIQMRKKSIVEQKRPDQKKKPANLFQDHDISTLVTGAN